MAKEEVVASGKYSSERLYEILGERIQLLEEKKRIQEVLEMRSEASESIEGEKPTRVHDLSEWEGYLYNREAARQLAADGQGQSRRLGEINRELEALPEKLLSEEVLPEGLWVRYGDTGVRADRDARGAASLTEYPWKAVEAAEGGSIAEVNEAARLREMGAIQRFSHLHPRIWRGTPIAFLSTVAVGLLASLLWMIVPTLWSALAAGLDALSSPGAGSGQDTGSPAPSGGPQAIADGMIRTLGTFIFILSMVVGAIQIMRGRVVSAMTFIVTGGILFALSSDPTALEGIGEWTLNMFGLESQSSQQGLPR